jgi:hypothetical protein
MMTLAEMIFDGLVWLIGGLVVFYMIRRYWAMFRASKKDSGKYCHALNRYSRPTLWYFIKHLFGIVF